MKKNVAERNHLGQRRERRRGMANPLIIRESGRGRSRWRTREGCATVGSVQSIPLFACATMGGWGRTAAEIERAAATGGNEESFRKRRPKEGGRGDSLRA